MSWKKPVPAVGYRHTIGFDAAGDNPIHDERFEMIDLVHRMYLKTRATLSSGQEYPYFVLTGPSALAVMAGQNQLVSPNPELIFVHGTRSQTLPFLRHHLGHGPSSQIALMEQIAARAMFPNFATKEFASSALATPLGNPGPTQHPDRGLRVMLHAALQSATVSRILVRRGKETLYRELPMPNPSGVLLLAIARYGHTKATFIEVSKRLSFTESPALTEAEREAGTKVRVQLEQQLNARRDDIHTVLGNLTNRTVYNSTGGYKVVGELVRQDPDVAALIGLTLADLPKASGNYVQTKLGQMDAETKAYLDELATLGTGSQPAARGTTRSRSPRER